MLTQYLILYNVDKYGIPMSIAFPILQIYLRFGMSLTALKKSKHVAC